MKTEYANEVKVGGLVPFTTIDYPGKLAAVVFCQGCTWKCTYCHNKHLRAIKKRKKNGYSERGIREFLQSRNSWIEAVVFSGGEPTIQEGLPDFINEVKSMGFSIGLHTAGPEPELFKPFLWLADWIGFDVKAPFDERYERITGIKNSGLKAKQSLKLLLDSGINYQLRTTVHPALLSEADLGDIKTQLHEMNATGEWVLQKAR